VAQQQRAVRSREAILRAAAQVIDRHGLMAATLSRVSAEAGLSKGAIYFHFANKDALASALEREAAHALDGLAAARAGAAGRPALTAIVETTQDLARLLTRNVVVRAGFQVDCDRAEGGVPLLRCRFTGLLTRLLEDARRVGRPAPRVPVDDIAATVLALTIGVQTLSRHPGTAQAVPRVLDRFWQVTLPGLLPGPPEAAGAAGDGAPSATADRRPDRGGRPG